MCCTSYVLICIILCQTSHWRTTCIQSSTHESCIWFAFDGLMQERRNSNVLAMELHLSYTNPLLCCVFFGPVPAEFIHTQQDCFTDTWTIMQLPLSFRVASLALGQSYDCPSASEATLKDTGKYVTWIHQELSMRTTMKQSPIYGKLL